jgi:hypothetical protein
VRKDSLCFALEGQAVRCLSRTYLSYLSERFSTGRGLDIEAYGLESQHQHQIEPEQNSELDPEQATTPVVQLGDAVIERAQESTRTARARMVKKNSKDMISNNSN